MGGLASTVFIPLFDALMTQMGWRAALWVMAALHALVCLPIHVLLLRGEPPPASAALATRTNPPGTPAKRPTGRQSLFDSAHQKTQFLRVSLFVVLMMGITAALPPCRRTW